MGKAEITRNSKKRRGLLCNGVMDFPVLPILGGKEMEKSSGSSPLSNGYVIKNEDNVVEKIC
jgi:hypothetical protein